MELTNEDNIVSVRGNIASIGDFEMIKQRIEATSSKHNNIVLKIYDSLVLNSSLIGYLVKIIKQDGIQINLHAGSETLFELLDDLALTKTLNLTKI